MKTPRPVEIGAQFEVVPLDAETQVAEAAVQQAQPLTTVRQASASEKPSLPHREVGGASGVVGDGADK